MTIVLAYFFCCSLVVIALFGIALYVTAAANRRLRAALAKVTETPVQNPADNLRRWHGANCPCAKCQEAVENELCARIGANVMAEHAAINRMVESLHKPDLAEAKAPVDADDAVEHYERFE